MTEQAKAPSGAGALRHAALGAVAAFCFALAGAAVAVTLGRDGGVLGGEFVVALAVCLAVVLGRDGIASKGVAPRRCWRQVGYLDTAPVRVGSATRAVDRVTEVVELGDVDSLHTLPGVLVCPDESLFLVIPEPSVPVLIEAGGVKQASIRSRLGLDRPTIFVRNAVCHV